MSHSSATPASPHPSPPAPAQKIVPPSTLAVGFTHLPRGSYPVHLHSRCSGLQGFHITVIGTLRVGAGGTGSISVPTSYFGNGLCLIVYTNTSLSAVLTTRQI
jgi:hypothetical protein